MHYDTSDSGLLESGYVITLWSSVCCSTQHVPAFHIQTLPCHSSAPSTGVTDVGRGDSDADSCVTAGGSRATLCVSSEVGCQMGCTFCATGTMGLKVTLALHLRRPDAHRPSREGHGRRCSKASLCCMQGDLTSGEIIEQLVHARALTPIRNVVFMGMGVGSRDLLCARQVLVTANTTCGSFLRLCGIHGIRAL